MSQVMWKMIYYLQLVRILKMMINFVSFGQNELVYILVRIVILTVYQIMDHILMN